MRKYNIKEKKYQEAMRLKYDGYKYKDIAKKIDGSIITINRWFEEKGILFKPYEEYREKQNKIREEEGLAILKKEIKNAIKTLLNLTKSKNEIVKLKATIATLERLLGKPKQTTELDIKNVDFIYKETDFDKLE